MFLVPIHVTGGVIAIVTGFVALYALKGGTLHRRSGMVFVYAMLVMSLIGAYVAVGRPGAAMNIPAGLITAYLVVTSLTTVRKPSPQRDRVERASMIAGFAFGTGSLIAAIVQGGLGRPQFAFPLVMFAALALGSARGDLRMIRAGGIGGKERIRRHLWRMSTALFIAAASFFLGPARRIPEPLQGPLFRAIPFVVLATMAVLAVAISPEKLVSRLQRQRNRGNPMNLRLWPAIAIAALMVVVVFAAPIVLPDEGSLVSAFGAVIGGVLILLWWLFFSRAPWLERIGVVAVIVGATFLLRFAVDPSIRGAAMQRGFPLLLALPWFTFGLAIAVIIARRATVAGRRMAIAIAIVVVSGLLLAIRTDGLWGGTLQLAWRWTPTAEEKLLARADAALVPSAPAAPPVAAPTPAPASVSEAAPPPKTSDAGAPSAGAVPAAKPGEESPAVSLDAPWPGFRGPARDGSVRGVQIATDWTKTPPVEVWRRPIGPAWSSFAVAGDMIYTQEQRGEDEIVASYSLSTGKPIWAHKDRARFYESNAGAGPRSTPAIDGGRVYTMGATGILNALDARTGARVWSRNTVTDAKIELPGWGITASPAIVGDVVVVAISGALAGYDKATGTPRWSRKSNGGSYSSPHVVTIDGVQQILLMAGAGTKSVSPVDGTVLWEHAWPGVPIVQPAQIAGGDFLITTADAMGAVGLRRLAVSHTGAGWTATERWTTRSLKPYFNDYVVHEGHAYGFDGNILACVDLADGARKWKGGRYGNGQFILLRDQDLLVVLSEEGELALVSATPGQFTELGRFKAIEGKTWNHPVLVGNLLLVRNGEEMAAFRLP